MLGTARNRLSPAGASPEAGRLAGRQAGRQAGSTAKESGGAQHGVRTLRGRQFRAVSCLCPSPDPRPGPLLCTGDQGVDCSLEAGGPCRGSRRLGRVGLKLPQTSSRTPALGTTALGQEDSRVLSPSLSPASWRSRASLAYLTVYIPFWKMCSFIRCCACTGHAAGARIRHDPWVWTPWSRN